MTDRIIVGGIKFHAYHGLTRLEREVGVRCSIDVEMEVDLSPAIASDRLADTIDYREIHRIVLEIGQDRRSFHLIESLGGKIAEEILARFAVGEVTVRVRKETPIIDGIVDYIGVQVTRHRAAAGGPSAPPAGRLRRAKR
ncbi:MAG TPA: dihydroneopterin aldolase [Candidatus Polarisedimenticolia bacterium]|nr:dihydroneopterin aldolase [Candidatus Polarisedimenticolia bacterium]